MLYEIHYNILMIIEIIFIIEGFNLGKGFKYFLLTKTCKSDPR